MRRDTLLLRRGTILFVAPEDRNSNSRILPFSLATLLPPFRWVTRDLLSSTFPPNFESPNTDPPAEKQSSGDEKSFRIRKFTSSSSSLRRTFVSYDRISRARFVIIFNYEKNQLKYSRTLSFC